jgi:uncharacterized protein involved in exopolysaccharide biosynthesis
LPQLQTPSVEYPTAREFVGVGKSLAEAAPARDKRIETLRVLWGGRRLITRITFAGLVAGMVLAFLLPNRYTSVAKLMPPNGQSSSGMAMFAAMSGKSGGLTGVAGDLLGVNGSGALFVGILGSETLRDRLVQRFDLQQVYRDKLDQDARKDLEERTGIAEDRKSGIITIRVTDRDPHRATAIAQAYAEELNRLSRELSTSAAHQERVFLEERLRDVKLDLDQAAIDFSQFSSKNTAIDIKEQGRAMVEAAAQLQGELIAAESEQKGLEAIYASTFPKVLAIRARIRELRKQLEKLGGAEGKEAAEPAAGSPYPSIRQLPILGVKYADLYRKTKIQETVYETLTQQYELAKVQEAKETPVVKVLDPARLPERRSFPPRLGITILCASFGLATGIGWVMGRNRWKRIEAMDPRKVFAEEVLHSVAGHMPWAPPNGSRGHAIAYQVWKRLMPRSASSRVPDES